MHRIDNVTAAGSLPTPASAGTAGYFSNATPGSGTPTIVDNDWCNDIQEELIAILTAAGTTPSKTTHNQVLTSLQALFTAKGVVGQARNLKSSLAAAGLSLTYTADELIVETALGGSQYQLNNYGQGINLATTGAGGMDTGACPTSGAVAIYAIYAPSTNTVSILGTNASSAAAPNIYAGGHMPATYTASALLGVIPTNSSPAVVPFTQIDRSIAIALTSILSTTSNVSAQSLTFTAAPLNARTLSGTLSVNSSSTSSTSGLAVSGSSNSGQLGAIKAEGNSLNSVGNTTSSFSGLQVLTAQTIYYWSNNSAATGGFNIFVSGYTI